MNRNRLRQQTVCGLPCLLYTCQCCQLAVDFRIIIISNKNILTCTASITNQSAIQAAYFHVYNGTKLLGSWKWEYGTSYLTHAFNLGSKAATHVQYVVYDGNEWKDKWTEIK